MSLGVEASGIHVKAFSAALLLLCLVGCYEQPKGSDSSRSLAFQHRPPTEIAEPQETEDFQDISLSIVSARQNRDATVIEAVGLHHRAPVSLRIVVTSGAGTVEIAEKDPGYRPAVLAWLGQS